MQTGFTTSEHKDFRERVKSAAHHDPLWISFFKMVRHELDSLDRDNRKHRTDPQPTAAEAYEDLLRMAGLEADLAAFTPMSRN